ncbi:hypothetical protein C8J56DRAFT_914622 [Mycena floridula]|nr:hypothetical protein C8J56DRAFT_914622 [Mycena floridula]
MQFSTSCLLSIVSLMLLAVHASPMYDPASLEGRATQATPTCNFDGTTKTKTCDRAACKEFKVCVWGGQRCSASTLPHIGPEHEAAMKVACENCRCVKQ